MRTEHLKIKIKTLAAEAAIIRHAERRAPTPERRSSLIEHRRGIVRNEQRHSLLAYGFLRGRPYSAMEKTCHQPPQWGKVKTMIERFGGRDSATRFDNELKAWAATE
jgi:hypothetical protein